MTLMPALCAAVAHVGMIRREIDDDLDAGVVRGRDETVESGPVARGVGEVLVRLLRIAHLVAVVRRERAVQGLQVAVVQRRSHPHRRDAHVLQVIDLLRQALEIAADVLAQVGAGRVEQRIGCVVVGAAAIEETVDEHLVDHVAVVAGAQGLRRGDCGHRKAAGDTEDCGCQAQRTQAAASRPACRIIA